jgi:uncharacterized protein (TIGR03085 family)
MADARPRRAPGPSRESHRRRARHLPPRGGLDELANTAEFLVHHEDVRRGQPDWTPRAADPVRDAATWKAASQSARQNFRKSPVGVILRTPDGREAAAKSGPDTVTIFGEPMDLLLYGVGRNAVDVSFEGAEAAVGALKGTSRSL